ncbi:GNAT family N-acetyltransferase [Micromonospora sp. NPDC023956]|uniref:GNAT family N-acetyltransferase n=1 Tax=Micromonospora sp. NPDC023956 TaxID=3155722 RepID=UPI00340D004D
MWKCEVVNGPSLDVAEVTALYRASGLAERRPVADGERFADMIRNANLVVVARINEKLVGIARSITDGAYVTYLSDIAVDREYQRRGIGVDLMRVTQEAAPRAKLVLLSAPAAAEYYPHVGFTRHPSAWVRDPLS